MRGSEKEGRAKHPVLAATAYLLVPGERRAKAAGHFRKAGFEALRGLNALARPERPAGKNSAQAERGKRRSIGID